MRSNEPSVAPGLQITLNELSHGERGVIEGLSIEGALGERLMEMGLTPGVDICVVRPARIGTPLVLSLRGFMLSLHHAQAAAISIRRPS